ncbi:MAG: hypothetical protein ACOCRX_03250 [Candidatus Woesearchaeota archaeon]
MRITKGSFDFESFDQITDNYMQVGVYEVPKNRIYRLAEDKQLGIYIANKETFTGSNSGSTHTLETQIAELKNHTDYNIYSDETEIVDHSVDYENNEITVEVADDDAEFTFEYIIRSGRFGIKAMAPKGASQQRSINIYENDLELIHQINQLDKKITPSAPLMLPEDFRISIYAKTDIEIAWDSSLTEIDIPVSDKDLQGFVNMIEDRQPEILQRNSLTSVIIQSWTSGV